MGLGGRKCCFRFLNFCKVLKILLCSSSSAVVLFSSGSADEFKEVIFFKIVLKQSYSPNINKNQLVQL